MLIKHDIHVSINIDILDVLSRVTTEYIFEMFEKYDITKNVTFEITEGEDIKNTSSFLEFIQKIKRLGSLVAIDDFGAGYSNYAQALMIGPDYLKIDDSLVGA